MTRVRATAYPQSFFTWINPAVTVAGRRGNRAGMFGQISNGESAAALVAAHGQGARQKVVDQIVIAIRAHDLPAAKRWEEVGRVVDQRLEARG